MKLKFENVKPGMLIKSKHVYGLITDMEGNRMPFMKGDCKCNYYVTFFDMHDPYWGQMVTSYDPKEKVKVIKGKKRKYLLSRIAIQLRKRITNAKREAQILYLIQGMDDE